MAFEHIRVAQSPRSTAVLLSILSGALLLVLCGSIALIAPEVEKQLAFRESEDFLQAGQLNQAKERLEVALGVSPAAWFEASFYNDNQDVILTRKRLVVRGLIDTVRTLGQGQLDTAFEQYHALYSSGMRLLVSENEHFAAIEGSAQKLLAEFKTASDEEKETHLLRQKINNEQRSLVQSSAAFNQLASEFSELLSLRPSPEKGEPLSQRVYQSGILAGAPSLQYLPDELEDLIAVKNQLDRMGGRVNVSGDNPHQEFRTKLSSIQERTREVVERFKTSTEAITTANNRFAALQAGQTRYSTKLNAGLHEQIKLLSLPATREDFPREGELILSIASKAMR